METGSKRPVREQLRVLIREHREKPALRLFHAGAVVGGEDLSSHPIGESYPGGLERGGSFSLIQLVGLGQQKVYLPSGGGGPFDQLLILGRNTAPDVDD